ncbi:holin family protein [Marinovum sp.]|uniref:holin family protein n=1 Tax=Marinovum sp. TaxID=2024839 RepID=UPI002B279B6D|nr:holin family protein [Marinovum sp.]
MGLIERALSLIFGHRNALAETVEVFRENAEKGAAREVTLQAATLAQFGQEFRVTRRGWFDRLMDAVNRLPRPAMALGTLGLFVAAMTDPVWFAGRMQGIALVPEPLWWLLGAIVSFYFGARHQAKGQDFQRELAQTVSRVPQVVDTLRRLEEMETTDAPETLRGTADNPALEAWRKEAA